MKADYTTPEWATAALLVIDFQADFLDGGASPIPGTSDVLDQVAGLAAEFRDAGLPIAHIVRLYEPGESDVDLLRRAAVESGARMVAPGSRGSQIPAQILPAPAELDAQTLLTGTPQVLRDKEAIFFKPRWSAFYRTQLEAWLSEHGVTTVVVAGCNLPNCPRATLFDASERDFRTVLVTDAVSQTTDERLADLSRIGVNLLTLREVRSSLQRGELVQPGGSRSVPDVDRRGNGVHREMLLTDTGDRVVLMNSISAADERDAGSIVVAGSHGGASAGEFASRYELRACFLNDAGVGKDNAGLAALVMLDTAGIPAATVSHRSARIGDARDHWEHGVLSHVNRAAATAGIKVGMTVQAASAELSHIASIDGLSA
jgi:nicotinamidase-related amidase